MKLVFPIERSSPYDFPRAFPAGKNPLSVQQVKSRFLGADVSQVSDPTRIQINLTGQAAGTFYVEMKGGHLAILAIEPYEYHDRDVEITISDENFQKLIDGKLDPVAAFTFGKLKAQGDLGKALELKKLIR